MKQPVFIAFAVVILWLPQLAAVPSDGREIDGLHSTITVRVFKSGFLSAFAHKLRVLDPDASDTTRAQIRKTMERPRVLDAERYSEISFRSTGLEPKGADHWLVTGNHLDLHGQSHPVTIEVTFEDEIYKGSGTLKQCSWKSQYLERE